MKKLFGRDFIIVLSLMVVVGVIFYFINDRGETPKLEEAVRSTVIGNEYAVENLSDYDLQKLKEGAEKLVFNELYDGTRDIPMHEYEWSDLENTIITSSTDEDNTTYDINGYVEYNGSIISYYFDYNVQIAVDAETESAELVNIDITPEP